jgi:hypothetical protein
MIVETYVCYLPKSLHDHGNYPSATSVLPVTNEPSELAR